MRPKTKGIFNKLVGGGMYDSTVGYDPESSSVYDELVVPAPGWHNATLKSILFHKGAAYLKWVVEAPSPPKGYEGHGGVRQLIHEFLCDYKVTHWWKGEEYNFSGGSLPQLPGEVQTVVWVSPKKLFTITKTMISILNSLEIDGTQYKIDQSSFYMSGVATSGLMKCVKEGSVASVMLTVKETHPDVLQFEKWVPTDTEGL